MTAEVVIAPGELAASERSALARHEQTIERGLSTFVEVGEALAAIKAGKLYRERHTTFEAYCQDRWSFTRQRANQIIRSAEIRASLETTVSIPSERAVRELGRVPPAKRAAVVEEAAKAGPVTGPTVKRAARRIAETTTDGEASSPGRRVVVDGTGREVDHPGVVEALGRVGRLRELVRMTHKVRREVEKLQAEPLGRELRQQIVLDLTNAANAIRFAVPFALCPYLRSHGDRGCKLCSGTGWVTREQLLRVPEDDREQAGVPAKEMWKR